MAASDKLMRLRLKPRPLLTKARCRQGKHGLTILWLPNHNRPCECLPPPLRDCWLEPLAVKQTSQALCPGCLT
mgnify:CR=1 FL=1